MVQAVPSMSLPYMAGRQDSRADGRGKCGWAGPLALGATAGGWYRRRRRGCPAMLVKLDADLSVMFGTQLFVRKQFLDPVTNAGLEKAVRARAATQPGIKVSNTGGWQSEPDLFDWREPEVGKLAAELDRAIQQFVSFGQAAPVRLTIRRAGWANVNRAGDYNCLHNHPQQHLAAVYYVKASPPVDAGARDGLLELRDPRPAAGF